MGPTPAELYALRTRDLDSDRPALEALLGGREVLEVGCGCGRILRWLLDWGAPRVVGIDLDAAKVALARETLGEHEALTLLTGDFCTQAVPRPAFERVLFGSKVVAELGGVAGRVAALRRAAACLAPGGAVVAMVTPRDFAAWAEEVRVHRFAIAEGWEVESRCTRDLLRQHAQCAVRYRHPATGRVVDDAYALDLVPRNELLATYLAAGLRVEAEHGGQGLGPLAAETKWLVHVLVAAD